MLAETLITENIMEFSNSAVILFLGNNSGEKNGIGCINKYQRTEKFFEEILFIYAEKTGRTEFVKQGKKDIEIISVYSTIGGSGKTSLSLAIANLLANKGKKILYLNFEKISSNGYVCSFNNEDSFSDILLLLKNRDKNVVFKILNSLNSNEEKSFFYFSPVESAYDYNDFSVDDFEFFINEISEIGNFNKIIIDLDSHFSELNINILEKSDKVIFPIIDSIISYQKIKGFIKEKNIHNNIKEIYDKTEFVINFVKRDNISDELTLLLENKKISAIIPFLVNMDSINSIQELTEKLEEFIYKMV